MPNPNFEFDFVISYAGEDKEQADTLYSALSKQGAKVFYAPEYQAELWGENLYEYLADIYSKKGLFCIPIISLSYVQKQWTRHEWQSAQERALKEVNTAYILPIRIDDTELPRLLSTKGYQDLRKITIEAIAQLAMAKLQLYLNKGEVGLDETPPVGETIAWEYTRLSFQRSGFLVKNNYLDPEDSAFADNLFTRELVDREGEIINRFLTLVATPIPEAIYVDLDELPKKLYVNDQRQHIGRDDEGRHWLNFDLGYMSGIRTTKADYVRFRYLHKSISEGAFHTEQYLRYCEDGGIELADGIYPSYEDKGHIAFNFVYILGTMIRFMNLAAYSYTTFGYARRFQLLVNLVNTENSFLGVFAGNGSRENTWPSAVSAIDGNIFRAYNQGSTSEPNLQFVYDIDTKRLFDKPEITFDLISDFSKKLQRSYNYPYAPRHYIPNTNEFPWRPYYQYLQY